MAKPLALVKRLRMELDATSSESEERLVYSRLYRIGFDALDEDFDKFYTLIMPKKIHERTNTSFSYEDSRKGEELSKILFDSVEPIIPAENQRGVSKRYLKKKDLESRKVEYNILRGFYGEKRRDSS